MNWQRATKSFSLAGGGTYAGFATAISTVSAAIVLGQDTTLAFYFAAITLVLLSRLLLALLAVKISAKIKIISNNIVAKELSESKDLLLNSTFFIMAYFSTYPVLYQLYNIDITHTSRFIVLVLVHQGL